MFATSKYLIIGVSLLLGLLLLGCGGKPRPSHITAQVPLTDDGVSIKGVVKVAETPLRFGLVSLTQLPGSGNGSATTGPVMRPPVTTLLSASGSYQFDKLAPGKYLVRVVTDKEEVLASVNEKLKKIAAHDLKTAARPPAGETKGVPPLPEIGKNRPGMGGSAGKGGSASMGRPRDMIGVPGGPPPGLDRVRGAGGHQSGAKGEEGDDAKDEGLGFNDPSNPLLADRPKRKPPSPKGREMAKQVRETIEDNYSKLSEDEQKLAKELQKKYGDYATGETPITIEVNPSSTEHNFSLKP